MWSRDPCCEGQCAERVMNIWGDEGWEALGVRSWCVCVCVRKSDIVREKRKPLYDFITCCV